MCNLKSLFVDLKLQNIMFSILHVFVLMQVFFVVFVWLFSYYALDLDSYLL